jgi:acetyltransferase
MQVRIQAVQPDDFFDQGSQFCELLADAVQDGASVGFLPPLDPIEALEYWDTVREAIIEGSRILLAAYAGEELLGSVQLGLEMRANGSHRAEVMKLLVSTKARRRGLGVALMQAAEAAARQLGRTLLVLDTRKGDPSWQLYQKLGYSIAGEIPGYARSANGELHSTVFFYKAI